MPRSVLVAFLVFAALGVQAQDEGRTPGPQTALSATYTFVTQDGDTKDWTTSQSAALGLTGRWGSSFKLDGQLRAPFDGTPLTADALIQQLALTWNLSSWSVLTVGKQRLKWGTARVFSAVDGLEPTFDPLHPRAVLDGVTGAKWEVLPTDWLSVTALVLPAPVLTDSKRALRLDALWGEADLSAGAIHQVISEVNHATFYADFAQFFERFGLYGEVEAKTYRDRWTAKGPDREWTGKATVGTQIEFPVWLNGTLRWLSEYHYNGDGFGSTEAHDFAATRAAVRRNLTVGTFSRHYGFSGVSGLPVTQTLSVGGSVLSGLDTGFVLARAEARYEVDRGLSVGVDYSRFDRWPGLPRHDSELMLLSQTNQVSLSVTGNY